MESGEPSRTARAAALLRAQHQVLDIPPVFEDALALSVAAALGADPPTGDVQDPRRRALRAFIAARSRFAEDRLSAAVQRGVTQYAILGAGLDTFAHRNPYREPCVRVYEVDHPATQQWKRARFHDAGIGQPEALTYVPMDFKRDVLFDALQRHGFEAAQPAVFSWLGVTAYLPEAAVMDTLRRIAGGSALSREIVFTIATCASETGARAAKLGEPWLSTFDPSAMQASLRQMGFRETAALGAGELNRLYFDNRADGLRVGGNGVILTARV
ncbi:MAG: class I SAM-dependent methyltransferase [SAR324 cluster bacterium]